MAQTSEQTQQLEEGILFDIELDKKSLKELLFTDQQINILEQMAKEVTSTKDIADALGIAPQTVKNTKFDKSEMRKLTTTPGIASTLGIKGMMNTLVKKDIESHQWIPSLWRMGLAYTVPKKVRE